MKNSGKLWLGILALALVFGLSMTACNSDEPEPEPEWVLPEMPPPATASVSMGSISVEDYGGASQKFSYRIKISLLLSPGGKWVNVDQIQAGGSSNALLAKVSSWIYLKDKDNKQIGTVIGAYEDKIGYNSTSGSNYSRLEIELFVGKSVKDKFDDYKPITVTLDTSRLDDMLEHTNVTDSLTAGVTISATLE